MELAKKLLSGKFHEIEDEEDIFNNAAMTNKFDGSKSIFMINKEELNQQSQLEKFENQLRHIIRENSHHVKLNDEIPSEIRKAFNLPEKMGIF